MNIHDRLGTVRPLAAMLSLTIGSFAEATDRREVEIPHEIAGYRPAMVEMDARGAELLVAGPDGHVAFFNSVNRQLVLLHDLKVLRAFPIHGATDIAFTSTGHLLVLDDPTRTLSMWSQRGELLDTFPLPDLAPLGGRLMVQDHEIRIRDHFGSLHRAGVWTEQGLVPSHGPLLIPQDLGLKWDPQERILWVDDQAWPLSEAIQASAQWVGSDWLVIDQVISDQPIQVRRVAHAVKEGTQVALPVEDRAYVPRRDIAEDADGHLLFLWPTEQFLKVVEVQP